MTRTSIASSTSISTLIQLFKYLTIYFKNGPNSLVQLLCYSSSFFTIHMVNLVNEIVSNAVDKCFFFLSFRIDNKTSLCPNSVLHLTITTDRKGYLYFRYIHGLDRNVLVKFEIALKQQKFISIISMSGYSIYVHKLSLRDPKH